MVIIKKWTIISPYNFWLVIYTKIKHVNSRFHLETFIHHMFLYSKNWVKVKDLPCANSTKTFYSRIANISLSPEKRLAAHKRIIGCKRREIIEKKHICKNGYKLHIKSCPNNKHRRIATMNMSNIHMVHPIYANVTWEYWIL